MDKDIMKMMRDAFKNLLSDDAPTKMFVGLKYAITVSSNPDKLSVKDFDTGKTLRIGDFNDLEISLMSLVASMCAAYGLYDEEA